MIVDDDQALSDALALTLSAEAAEVRTCTTMEQAIAALQHLNPDVVVLDLSLPDGDAFEVLEAIGRHSPTPAVVAISGVASPLDSFRLGQLGVASFLSKPFTMAELLQAVEEALTRPANLKPVLCSALGQTSLHELEANVRSTLVEEALARANGSRTRAAALLGVSRQLLQFILRRVRAAP